jgi:hypothetical protein
MLSKGMEEYGAKARGGSCGSSQSETEAGKAVYLILPRCASRKQYALVRSLLVSFF